MGDRSPGQSRLHSGDLHFLSPGPTGLDAGGHLQSEFVLSPGQKLYKRPLAISPAGPTLTISLV